MGNYNIINKLKEKGILIDDQEPNNNNKKEKQENKKQPNKTTKTLIKYSKDQTPSQQRASHEYKMRSEKKKRNEENKKRYEPAMWFIDKYKIDRKKLRIECLYKNTILNGRHAFLDNAGKTFNEMWEDYYSVINSSKYINVDEKKFIKYIMQKEFALFMLRDENMKFDDKFDLYYNEFIQGKEKIYVFYKDSTTTYKGYRYTVIYNEEEGYTLQFYKRGCSNVIECKGLNEINRKCGELGEYLLKYIKSKEIIEKIKNNRECGLR